MAEKATDAVENETADDKAVDQAAGQEQVEEVENDNADDTAADDASGQGTNDEDDIDYAAELERVQTERDNYKQGMLDAKDKLKNTKKQPVATDADEDQDDDTVTRAVDSALTKRRAEEVADTVDELLEGITDNPAKRALIEDHYNNSIVKSGYSRKNILNDLRNAEALAERQRLVRENAEMKQTMRIKKTITNSSVGNNQDRPVVDKQPKVSADEKNLLDQADRYVKTNISSKPAK